MSGNQNNAGCLGQFLKLIGIEGPKGGKPEEPSAEVTYGISKRLFSPAETNFYRVLESVMDQENQRLIAKVRLADVIYVKSAAKKLAESNKIRSKHVDYVLLDRETMAPVLVIELDDKSHNRADRQARDRFVDAALASAGLPILRVKVSQSYDTAALREQIAVKQGASNGR